MTLKDCISDVAHFQRTFGLPIETSPTARLSENIVTLRHRLMAEENEEYLEAARQGDMVEIADALGDMLYILCGTIVSHGMPDISGEVFTTIQASNMSKLGPDGNPIYREDGKVMKGPDYFRPDIAGVLERAGVTSDVQPAGE